MDAPPESDSQDTPASTHSLSQDIRQGLTETWAIGLGLIPLGLSFGLLVVQSGFAWWWAPIFSTIIYAGSMEFLAISLVSGGLGLVSGGLTAFMVNFRHVFYGLTFPLHAIHCRAGRAYAVYSLTDEAYAIASAGVVKGALSGARVLTIQATVQALWLLSGLAGALVGQYIPTMEGLSFALVALFIVLTMESFSANRDWSLPLCALACGAVGWVVSETSLMVVGLGLYLGVLLVRFWSPAIDRAMTVRRDSAGFMHIPDSQSRDLGADGGSTGEHGRGGEGSW